LLDTLVQAIGGYCVNNSVIIIFMILVIFKYKANTTSATSSKQLNGGPAYQGFPH